MMKTYEELVKLLELAADALETAHTGTSNAQHQVRKALTALHDAIHDGDYGGTDQTWYCPPEEL